MTTAVDRPITTSLRLLSKQQVASLLGYTTRTIDRLIQSRKIPFISLPTATGDSRKIRFIEAEIQAWLEDNRVVVLQNWGAN